MSAVLERFLIRRQDMTFDEWWKQMKPAECDELKQVFEECWESSAVWCADVCDEQSKRLQPPGNGRMYKAAQSCRREIFKRLEAWMGVRSNAELMGAPQRIVWPDSSVSAQPNFKE